MAKKYIPGLGTLFLMVCLPIVTPARFSISVELRPRSEYRDGYKLLSQESSIPAVFISQRSRLGFHYKTADLNTAIILQDVRVWGDESVFNSTGVTGDAASLDIKEAWTEYISHCGLSFKVGRQEFNYDDQRLLSRRNWNQSGVNYDAFLIKFIKDSWQLHLALSLNNDAENKFGNEYPSGKLKTLDFIYFQQSISKQLSLSAIALGSGYTASDSSEIIYMRGTYGANLAYETEILNLRTAGYYQNGKNKTGQNVSAYLMTLDLQYSMKIANLGGGIVYLSGQDAANTDADYQKTDHMFDIVYGSRHRYYGLMDYFSNMPSGTDDGGLVDLFGKFEIGQSKLKFQLAPHIFYLQNNVLTESNEEPLDKYLGTEFDFSTTAKISDELILQCGYSVMLPSESLEQVQDLTAGGSDYSHWAWIMLSCKTTILKSQ